MLQIYSHRLVVSQAPALSPKVEQTIDSLLGNRNPEVILAIKQEILRRIQVGNLNEIDLLGPRGTKIIVDIGVAITNRKGMPQLAIELSNLLQSSAAPQQSRKIQDFMGNFHY